MANLATVLEKVNAGRVACGALPLNDLPKGFRSDNKRCPLARALKEALPGIEVGSSAANNVKRDRAPALAAAIDGRVIDINGTASVQLPVELQQFVSDFDQGRYPQYQL